MRSDLKQIIAQMNDPDNNELIVLENDRGEVKYFNCNALIPITTPSEDFEDEMVEHNFALMRPTDKDGKEIGELLVFDFLVDENEQVSLSIVDDPYVMRDLITIFRQRGKKGDLALTPDEDENENKPEECESIFGGTILDESGVVAEIEDDGEKTEEELEDELRADVSPKKKKKEKKSFFGKMFGKK